MENTFGKIVTHLMPSAPNWAELYPVKQKKVREKKVKPVKEKKVKKIKEKKPRRPRAKPIKPPKVPYIEPQTPHLLLDTLRKKYQCKSDAKLADILDVEKAILSYVRQRKMQLTPSLLIRIYDNTDLTIENIRELWFNSSTT